MHTPEKYDAHHQLLIEVLATRSIYHENSETKVYYGICETTFKLRYANHQK